MASSTAELFCQQPTEDQYVAYTSFSSIFAGASDEGGALEAAVVSPTRGEETTFHELCDNPDLPTASDSPPAATSAALEQPQQTPADAMAQGHQMLSQLSHRQADMAQMVRAIQALLAWGALAKHGLFDTQEQRLSSLDAEGSRPGKHSPMSALPPGLSPQLHEALLAACRAGDLGQLLAYSGSLQSEPHVDLPSATQEGGDPPPGPGSPAGGSAGTPISTPVQDVTLTYCDFLRRLRGPGCAAVADEIRRFFAYVLAPVMQDPRGPAAGRGRMTNRPPPRDLPTRCCSFLDATEARLLADPGRWLSTDARAATAGDHDARHVAAADASAGSENRLTVRGCLERYVLGKIYPVAFRQCQDPGRDRAVDRRLRSLRFLTCQDLDVAEHARSPSVLRLAQTELRAIDSHRCPADKVECVSRCCNLLFAMLHLEPPRPPPPDSPGAPARGPLPKGADDFLPVFIYVVLMANPPRLYSNCEYLQAYLSPAALMSRAGYCFINLRSAMEFLMHLEPALLEMDPEEYSRKLSNGEAIVHLQDLEAQQRRNRAQQAPPQQQGGEVTVV